MVIGINAMLELDTNDNKEIHLNKSETLAIDSDSKFQEKFNLPNKVKVIYETENMNQNRNWNEIADKFEPFNPTNFPNYSDISGWKIFSYGVGFDKETLTNLALEVTTTEKTVIIHLIAKNIPECSRKNFEKAEYKVTIIPDPNANI